MKKRLALFSLLLVALIDFLGIGLVYPLFSFLMFHKDATLLPPHTSELLRGVYLGVIISIYSIGQFISGPILGTLSDRIGRKKVLLMSLALNAFGYFISIVGIELMSLSILCVARLIIGIAAGSAGVVQAAIADISTNEDKSKHFGYYSMFFGIGFTIGPFLGGLLSSPSFFKGYSLPFWIAAIFCILNFLLALFYFQETHFALSKQKISFFHGFTQFKKAFSLKGTRLVMGVIFIYIFGWSFYFEFIPIYLIGKFNFDVIDIGNFYGYSTAWLAFGSGVLLMPLLKRFKLETILFSSLTLLGIYIFCFLFVTNTSYLWIYLPIQAYFNILYFTSRNLDCFKFSR